MAILLLPVAAVLRGLGIAAMRIAIFLNSAAGRGASRREDHAGKD
ncbi:hypothetical protein [Aureimonas endophytica]|nr:hypothetical protein [Aureimonas endophytica]